MDSRYQQFTDLFGRQTGQLADDLRFGQPERFVPVDIQQIVFLLFRREFSQLQQRIIPVDHVSGFHGLRYQLPVSSVESKVFDDPAVGIEDHEIHGFLPGIRNYECFGLFFNPPVDRCFTSVTKVNINIRRHSEQTDEVVDRLYLFHGETYLTVHGRVVKFIEAHTIVRLSAAVYPFVEKPLHRATRDLTDGLQKIVGFGSLVRIRLQIRFDHQPECAVAQHIPQHIHHQRPFGIKPGMTSATVPHGKIVLFGCRSRVEQLLVAHLLIVIVAKNMLFKLFGPVGCKTFGKPHIPGFQVRDVISEPLVCQFMGIDIHKIPSVPGTAVHHQKIAVNR